MSRKISLGVALAVAILCITATFAVTMTVAQRIYNGLIPDLAGRFQLYSGIDKIDEIVKNKYYSPIDSSMLNEGIYQGYVSSLDKCSYLTSDEYVSYANRLKGELGGIGIEASYNYTGQYLGVTTVYSGSPADSAGLKVGDEIYAINGEDVEDSNYVELLDSLRGSKLTTAGVEFRRNGKQMQESITMGYSASTVTYSTSGSIGYININAFYENTAKQFKEAIDAVMADSGITGLIIDVRSTSQGSILYATDVLDVIVPLMDYPIAVAKNKQGETIKDENGIDVYSYPAEKSSITMPKKIAVLVNSTTSGAGELLASALADYDITRSITTVVGEVTAGDAKMQLPFRLEDGNAILVTVAKLVSGKSETDFDGIGVTPAVTAQLAAGQQMITTLDGTDISGDSQLAAAYSAATYSEIK